MSDIKNARREAYLEKLRDPRWQKKRLEVFQRDDFTCQYCLSDESTLHVHHYWYEGEPWDVPNEALITLCETCHEYETTQRYEIERKLIEVLRKRSASAYQVEAIAELIAHHGDLHIIIQMLNHYGIYDMAAALFDRDYEAFKSTADSVLANEFNEIVK